jgi:rubredoxin
MTDTEETAGTALAEAPRETSPETSEDAPFRCGCPDCKALRHGGRARRGAQRG